MANIVERKQAKILRSTNLSRLIRATGLSLRKFASKLGVRPATVQSWGEGKAVPSLDNMVKLSALLGMSLDDLSQAIGFACSAKRVSPRAKIKASAKYGKHPLARLIKETGFTREEIAEEIGVSISTVAAWATGRSVPAFENICAMSKMLDISVQTLSDAILLGDRASNTASNVVD